MPRKRKADQAGRFAKNRKRRNQWRPPHIWGSRRDLVTGGQEHRSVEVAMDRWFARHECSGECRGLCDRYRRVTRMHAMYRRRR